jgi:cytochrome c-type biogenesis protein CcmH
VTSAFLALALLAAPAASSLGPPQGRALAGEELEAEAHRVSALLRCPVCQGLSVADSPVDLARDMRGQVRELLAEGYSEEQILDYFEHAYGEFVRLEPKLSGVNWLVWLAPIAGLLGGALVVGWALRRGGEPPPRGAVAPDDALPDDPELARYVSKVRELAYGWPRGTRPSPEGSDGAEA